MEVFRILKEHLQMYPFDTVEALRRALLEFKERYNHSWILERHACRTPAQARRDHFARQQEAA